MSKRKRGDGGSPEATGPLTLRIETGKRTAERYDVPWYRGTPYWPGQVGKALKWPCLVIDPESFSVPTNVVRARPKRWALLVKFIGESEQYFWPKPTDFSLITKSDIQGIVSRIAPSDRKTAFEEAMLVAPDAYALPQANTHGQNPPKASARKAAAPPRPTSKRAAPRRSEPPAPVASSSKITRAKSTALSRVATPDSTEEAGPLFIPSEFGLQKNPRLLRSAMATPTSRSMDAPTESIVHRNLKRLSPLTDLDDDEDVKADSLPPLSDIMETPEEVPEEEPDLASMFQVPLKRSPSRKPAKATKQPRFESTSTVASSAASIVSTDSAASAKTLDFGKPRSAEAKTKAIASMQACLDLHGDLWQLTAAHLYDLGFRDGSWLAWLNVVEMRDFMARAHPNPLSFLARARVGDLYEAGQIETPASTYARRPLGDERAEALAVAINGELDGLGDIAAEGLRELGFESPEFLKLLAARQGQHEFFQQARALPPLAVYLLATRAIEFSNLA